jgi:hypothetical protein
MRRYLPEERLRAALDISGHLGMAPQRAREMARRVREALTGEGKR